MNQITLMGRLGKDAWISQKGESLEFTLATSESWKDKEDQWQQRTDWHYCKVFGAKKDYLLEKLKQGKRVLISGKQKNNLNMKDGELSNFSYVNVRDIKILDKSEESMTFSIDEIPF